MALTKQDLQEIVKISSRQTEELAIMVRDVFDGIDKRFDGVDKRFDEVDKRFDGVDNCFGEVDKRFDRIDASHRTVIARLDLIETDLSHMRNLVTEVKLLRRLLKDKPSMDMFKLIDKRLLRVEKQLGFAKS
ncbi:hypothetical protein GW889_02130 [Candidatus Berkelbacteria bacterium]|nr:hypothetical protein [Candidatus Berkelbacteria bacterium]OIP06469.1 MAG: hypothetical protein AUK41_02585 [Candidatus Berkelbacteria bacterium CG2_30_43_20]PIU86984.1 MAG: hypothetical protein COS66_03345 [Candidatus Berkelbacteria bacterium CG06_land_8_20_14_3_00_43_10]